jgi:hypothetical protein
MSILRQRVRSTRALLGPTGLPVVQEREARATAFNVYGRLGGTHEGQGSHRKKGKAPKPGLSRRDHGQAGNQAPRLTRALQGHECESIFQLLNPMGPDKSRELNWQWLAQIQTTPETKPGESKQVNNVLVRRGKELHEPDRMYLNPTQILFVEPVGPNSKVAQSRRMRAIETEAPRTSLGRCLGHTCQQLVSIRLAMSPHR